MSNRESFNINISKDDTGIVEVSLSTSKDFNSDIEFPDLVKKLEAVFNSNQHQSNLLFHSLKLDWRFGGSGDGLKVPFIFIHWVFKAPRCIADMKLVGPCINKRFSSVDNLALVFNISFLQSMLSICIITTTCLQDKTPYGVAIIRWTSINSIRNGM